MAYNVFLHLGRPELDPRAAWRTIRLLDDAHHPWLGSEWENQIEPWTGLCAGFGKEGDGNGND